MNYRSWRMNQIWIIKRKYYRLNNHLSGVQRHMDRFYKYNEMYMVDEWEG